MKKTFLIFILILTLVMGFGCTKKAQEETEISLEKIEYKLGELKDLPEKFHSIVENMIKERGYIYLTDEDKKFIIVSSGMKMTGGYTIEIKSFGKAEDEGRLIILEESPRAGEPVTEAITYPHLIIEVLEDINKFQVVNTEGDEFRFLELEDIEVVAIGEYTGQIDNNFIEIMVEGQPGVLMLTDDTRQLIKDLKINTPAEFTYYKNLQGMLVLKDIEVLEQEAKAVKTAKGVYVGQIDPTFIEVTVDGEPMVFMSYNMEEALKGIKDGDKVIVNYTERENGNLEIESIEKDE